MQGLAAHGASLDKIAKYVADLGERHNQLVKAYKELYIELVRKGVLGEPGQPPEDAEASAE
jgi:hypothetical protein